MFPDVPVVEIFPVLKDNVALITGGAQGMGKVTAEAFLKAGAKVVICDIQDAKGNEVARELSPLVRYTSPRRTFRHHSRSRR
jgi:glucose 1-dehydrogenase